MMFHRCRKSLVRMIRESAVRLNSDYCLLTPVSCG
jgi:hypothetical protein